MPAISMEQASAYKKTIKNMQKTLLAILIILFGFILRPVFADNKMITLGKNTFCVPKKHSTLDQTSGPLFNISGADTDRERNGSFQVSIDQEEIKKSIPAYALAEGEYPAIFFIDVNRVSSSERQRLLSSEIYADKLQLTGKYNKALTQYLEKYDYYRVSDSALPPPFLIWSVLSIKPNKNATLPKTLGEYYVGRCSGNAAVKMLNDKSTFCQYAFEIAADDYLVTIKTSEDNLHLKKQLNQYAVNKLNIWKNNCK